MLKPDSIYKCVRTQKVHNKDMVLIKFIEGERFLRTRENGMVFLNDYNNPGRQAPVFTDEEFAKLEGDVLQLDGAA